MSVSKIKVPYVDLPLQARNMKRELLSAVEAVLDHGKFILGPEVTEFEKRFAKYCGTKYAVGVDNGTNSLLLTLKALSIGPGDEVITAPNSFFASASCIALSGAKPVFVDVRDDYNINPHLIEKSVTSRTKAIILVHLTGRPADLDPIIEISKKHNFYIIEDCAQAVGAAYNDKKVGSFGIAGCFSFHPLKNLNAIGDGGIISTSSRSMYLKLKKARNHGLRNRDECEFWSYNSRLDCIHAAVLLKKMPYIDIWNEQRRRNAFFYRNAIGDIVRVPFDEPNIQSVYHTFMIYASRRDDLQIFLLNKGIETKINYSVPIHLQEAANTLGYREGSLPVAERHAKHILSIPIYPELTDLQMHYVAEAIRDFYKGKATTRNTLLKSKRT